MGIQSARISWQPVDKVLVYQVTVKNWNSLNTTIFSNNVFGITLDVQNILPCSPYQISVSSLNAFLEAGEPRQVNYTTNTLGPVTSVSVDYSCASQSAVISWTAVFGATAYRATAISQSGAILSCTSNSTKCHLRNLTCGERYTVHATALSNNCESTGNATTYLQTAPCSPSNLMLYRECSSNVIIFSWAPNNLSAYYHARAVDSNNKIMECMTKDTSCFFTDTTCGLLYNFTVFGLSSLVGQQCTTETSSSIQIRTAPCPARNMQSSTNCQTGLLTSSWEGAEGALSYTVEAFGNNDNQSHYMCSSVTQSCSIPGIHCGESLTMIITTADDECSSVLSLGEVGYTPPCVPQNVTAVMDCSANSIRLRWQASLGALLYIAQVVDQFGTVHTCKSMDPNCQITGLSCGTMYSAFVIASNFICNSSFSQTISVETAPCPPGDVQAVLDCQENQALVSWLGSRGMISFTATMEDPVGGLLSCSTTASSCRIPDLKCGQVYAISVSHHDGICPSMPSQAIQMKSVPCGPTHVHGEVQCLSGVLSMSWDRTEDAEGYIATVVSTSTGRLVYCNSTLPACNVSNLQCGDAYSVQVRSYNDSCLSMLSEPLVIREVPCAPTNVTAQRTCGKSSVEVSWLASRGAQSYVAMAVGESGHRTSCFSNTTTCSILDLHCSSVYSISLTAVDGNCSSLESQSVTLHTVPCPPTDVQSTVNCSTNSATLSWTASLNAVSYRGRALGRDGHNVTCDGRTPGCQLNGLHCGQEYVFVVTASDGLCESPNSVEYRHETAPCAPQNVSRFLDCASNSLNVSWALGLRALNYTVLTRTTGGAVLSCTTTTSSCVVTGLQCGQNYTAVITATNGECQGPESVTRPVQSVPCIPTSVRANVECASNTVKASWGPAAGALSYISVLTGPDSYRESCMTSDPSCSFTGLTCAQTYTLNVISQDSQCSSLVSSNVSVTTAPCDPESVTAVLNCDARTVSVSWQAGAGATRYTVLAQTQNQSIPSTSCHSSATSCELMQLQCGEVFNVTVFADNGACNSSARASTTLETAPCAPTMRSPPSLNCSNNLALVSWAENPDAVSVLVNATSVLGHTATCSSSANNCSLAALLCGQTYSVYGTAQGSQCESTPSAPFSIITAPCSPAELSANYSCGTSTALLSWAESLGRESFYVHVETSAHSDSCSTAQTHCSINSLRCGSLYNVSVDSVSGRCNSSDAAHTQLQTAPCAPQNVTVRLQCSNNTAFVSWEGSPGAVAYNVTAVGRDGDVRHSIVNGTSCQLPNMHCSQTYDIVIIPFSETCAGFPTTPYTFSAGSCPPSQVEVSLQCSGNVGLVNWTATTNAEMYIATAKGLNGHTHTCSSNGTSCTFSELHCGENYTVTVSTVERGCQSQPSTPVNLRSAICPPSNLAGRTNCATNDISITWDPSTASGATYFLFIRQVNGLNSTTSTVQTSHALTGLHCGMSFIAQVAAQDSTCTSPYGSPTQVYTAPCPPSSLAAAASCGTNRGTISWQTGAGAQSYTANVVGNNGHTGSCTSNTTSCSVKLECGLRYTATVVSAVGFCNSTANNSIQFDSALCLPSNVMAQLDCNANTAAVHWDPSANNPDSYTALAIGTDGTRMSCNTSSTSCTIQNLRCGRTYSIAVTTSQINCGIIEGSDYHIETAPCQPQRPFVLMQCSTNIASVTWDNNGADQFDMVTALNLSGDAIVCNSTKRSCTFTQLRCGESYTLNVVGLHGNCTSEPSENFSLDTAPCVPTYVVATTDCETSITTVTWDPARGASIYTVHAVSARANNRTCTNIDTSCSFSDLDCGQNYTITVTAEDGNCVSLASAPITVTTVPCPHSNLQSTLDCSTDTALISWTPGSGTLMYNVSADGFDVDHEVSCRTSGSACNITNLYCGSRYQVSVSGEGLTCPSQSFNWIALNSAPCPPTHVSIESSCGSNTVSVSWKASQGSVSYMAVAEGSGGHRVTCDTTQKTCNIIGLQCGQTYQIYVSGVDGGCIGSRSEVHILETAPCVPENVLTIIECPSTVLNITWQQRGQAHHYHTTVRSSDGQVLGCDSNATFCQVPHILCGLTYNVTVAAYSQTCNSSQSSVQHVTSAPCPPDDLSAVLDCKSNTVSVSWDSSVDGVHYIAKAFYSNNDHNYYMCNTTKTSCDIPLTCGRDYNVTVVPVRDGCNGANAPVQYLMAAPCTPLMLGVEMDCLSDSAWLTWEESAGAEIYIAMATDSDGQVYPCNSTENQCTVEQLQCGRFYNFSITASNSQCDSHSSNTMESETAPCPPQNVYTAVGCDFDMVTVLWDDSFGALNYTATLERTDGETTCCTANSTSCEVTSLPCGQMYVLTVTAEGRTCNSSQSIEVIVRSVPCTPENLVSSTSCSDNVATMSWMSNDVANVYMVTAISNDGLHSVSCSSFSQSCDLTNLKCGVPYTATVIAQDSICTSPPSQAATIRTVPCVPDYVTANVICQENGLSVFWKESAGAESYTALLEDSYGHFTNCQSMNDTTCTVNRLPCGQTYHVSVIASDGYCDSSPSAAIYADSAPCIPRDIRALIDCQSGMAILSWQPGTGAVQYMTTAVSESGHVLTCESNNTNCELTGLACGESYNITVLAEGPNCSSVATMRGQLKTGPCVPQHVEVQYGLSIGQLSWDMSRGATRYTTQAATDLGSVLSCSTSDTSCVLYNLSCSQTYDIIVTAHNNVCQGTAVSASATLNTEPCPPQNVQTHLNCSSDVGTVSWEESLGAVAYVAFLEGRNGQSLSCYTTSSSCSVAGLVCGTVYITHVRAIGGTYNSTDSETVLLTSAPCPPVSSSVTVSVICDNATALFSWAWSGGAASYELTAISNNGYTATCISQENYCNISKLVCGQTYKVRLTAINDGCQVTEETGVTFQTRPCAPLHVNVDFQCQSRAAVLTWEQRDDVLYYLASVTLSTGEVATVCNSTTDSCEMSGLRCGVEYAFTVSAYSRYCHSDVSSTVHIQTEPCQPTQLTVSGSCDNNTVHLNWNHSRGALSYSVFIVSNLGYADSFQTSESMLTAELLCGQTYTFTAVGQNDICDSIPSIPAHLTTAPCVPYNIQTFAECETYLGAVSWAGSDGADIYTAIAEGQDGHTHICITNTTFCIWEDLHCGEIYVVQVVANAQICSSNPSESTIINMAPCIPQLLVSSFDCDMRVASLTWEESENASMYLVSAESSSGHRVALSTNNTSAQFSEFNCGQPYFLTVLVVGNVCRSPPSNASVLQTEPCTPTSISGFNDCISNIATVSWEPVDGAEYYTATVQGPDGPLGTCMSWSASCGMPKLPCGHTYNVSVIASSRQCNSTPSALSTINTVPCVPMGVSVVLDCATAEARVSWNASMGALYYTAYAWSSTLNFISCSSTGPVTHCILSDLICGDEYTVQVIAVGDECSSLPSQTEQFHTVPCAPKVTSTHLDCYTDAVLLQWTPTVGSVSYTADARTPGGLISTCSSNSTNCELKGLACGQTYNLTMISYNGHCHSQPGTALAVASVPCPPQRVESNLLCSSNSASVQWNPGMGAESYEVHAISTGGQMTGCDTTNTSCVVPNLVCGSIYNISVLAIGHHCNVSKSAITTLHSVPCIPNQIQANLSCESGVVDVSWQPSQGAFSYSAIAQGSGGFASSCNSTSTTCEFTNLLCGLTYSISVTASDHTCTSAQSHSVELDTVPCKPTGIITEIECGSHTGVVSWEQGEHVASYLVLASSPDGHRTHCSSPTSMCKLDSLHCGQAYNLTITAQDSHCDSKNALSTLQSVPCSPINVQASLVCLSNSAAVTWQSTSGALSYQAEGITLDGTHMANCSSSNTTHCNLEHLLCGRTYNVSVLSMDHACSSERSLFTQVHTAPCPPQDVDVQVNCSAGFMTVTWAANPDAESFHVRAATSGGALLSCDSTSTSCSIPGLPCGQSYSVTVTSVRGGCESQPSTAVNITSAPCVPQGEAGNLDCVTNSAWVTWLQAMGAESYSVLAVERGGANASCSASDLHCNVPDLQCGATYTFHITAMNSFCRSGPSNTFQIQTAPCALTSITAHTDCFSSHITVSWTLNEGSSFYVATAEGHDQSILMCNSTSTSCNLTEAKCGMQYTIIISASSDKCSSLRSSPLKMNTAPCVPQNVTMNPVCDSNGMVASWSPSLVAESYSLTASGGDGDVRTCRSTANNCTLLHLHCGQMYNVSITASAGNCTSLASQQVTFHTVPCEPQNMSVEVQCDTRTATLSWVESQGSLKYFTLAQTMDGHTVHCDTTGTSCSLTGLTCGTLYNFTAQASDGTCNSSLTVPIQRGAVPCPPATVRVRTHLMDDATLIRVSWSFVVCPNVTYLVQVTGQIQDNQQPNMDVSSYWTNGNYFEFPVPCSTSYNVTVFAQNSAGISRPSQTVTGVTVPCPPMNVTFTGDNSSATVAWRSSVLTTGFKVYQLRPDVQVPVCLTSDLSCQVSGLLASDVAVTAWNSAGESLSSRVTGQTLNRRKRNLKYARMTAALTPDQLSIPEVKVAHVTGQSLQVEWSQVTGADSYTVILTEDTPSLPAQEVLSIYKTEIATLTDLKPATRYCVTVSAKHNSIQSAYSQPLCVTTE
ncbi:uncharacterized protein fndc7b [Siphateles boraxobius]|uniref:uncharacterized protein fndc7b n=1 Tax=Siphateles boraxobius TaxID=180520 RepID=UPI0040649B81